MDLPLWVSIAIVLVGDSTMATRTGYGDAFCALFQRDVECVNLARGGRSSKSYRAEGLWDSVMAGLGDRARNRNTYVLIQFGHNDQPGKAERTTDLATEFPANIARYADEVRQAGATAVLVTPLTRRTFRDGVFDNDLKPWADATRGIAQAKRLPLLDLNADSSTAVAAMGSSEADTLAMEAKDFDRTHLGAKGAPFFARMAAKELVDAVPGLARHLKTRPQLSEAQARGYSYEAVLKPWDPLGDPLATGAALTPDFIVDPLAKPDGTKIFDSVQSAVSAAISRDTKGVRRYILVKPGIYRELLSVPDAPTPITLYGEGSDAAAVRITETLPASVAGSTPASAVTKIRNHGFQAKNITFENAFNKERGDWIAEGDERVVQRQAVALMVDGADRVQFENVRFIGFQDTLFLRTSAPGKTVRVFVHRSYVEGDMDFIFGDATAYFLRSEIKSLGDRRVSYLLAPSTHATTRFGFVFNECRFTHDGSPNALTGTFKLARQWFQGQDPKAVGKAVILNSTIGAHIDRMQPWADWGIGTPRYRPVQYDSDGEPYLAEYNNSE